MDALEPADSISEAAANWVVKSDRGLSPFEQNQLDAWISADSRHRGALARAQAIWLESDRAQIFKTVTYTSSSYATARFPGVRSLKTWAAVACVVLMTSFGFFTWRAYAKTHLMTEMGEIRHLPLEDGSSVTLNTQSQLNIAYSPGARIVRLDQGEAIFDVAPDSRRPFVVEAGNVRVRAVGTEFVVRRRDASDAQITVTHGTVEVWRETSTPEPSVRVSAGRLTVVTEKAVAEPKGLSEIELSQSVAWQDGVLDLNGRTLAEAAAEFNRYNHNEVVISDSTLLNQRVVGRFRTSDPQGFATAVAAMFNTRTRHEGSQIIIERGSSP